MLRTKVFRLHGPGFSQLCYAGSSGPFAFRPPPGRQDLCFWTETEFEEISCSEKGNLVPFLLRNYECAMAKVRVFGLPIHVGEHLFTDSAHGYSGGFCAVHQTFCNPRDMGKDDSEEPGLFSNPIPT